MPIQAPQWADYLNCPACCREFGQSRSPVSLGCGHTLCKPCIKNLHKKQCPFEQTVISVDLEDLVVNTALLQLAGYTPPSQPYHPPSIQALSEQDRHAYDVIIKALEQLAVFLKYCGNANTNTGSRLSRPMQRKLVTLLQCAITDEEGRGKAARAARSLGDRTVTELIVQHQNPQQLSANLWAAVRSRGCQFLGPAMQEEVLKLVLLALEDGSALSRKVLVMFVVQRLEPHFPQASKTSIGHVVQLLYRASCFKVSKRVCDSSLMQLKEEFRTYESLRREHDAQIVQIATEAGLRIAPDQWSALLYGDSQHKSHMQSIIDKLQTPQSFAQSVQELFITLQRTGDPAHLIGLSVPLDRLANIDASPDAKSPTWLQLSAIMTSLQNIVSRLVHFMQEQSNANREANLNPKTDRSPDTLTQQSSIPGVVPGRYKVAMCRDAQNNTYCPRGNNCTYAHSDEELERYRRINSAVSTGNYQYVMQAAIALPRTGYQRYSVPPPPLPTMDQNCNMPPMQQPVSPSLRRPLVGVDALDHEQPYDKQREQPYDQQREQPYDQQREQPYEQPYKHQHEQPYEQSYDHQREQSYDHQREQPYDHQREQPYEQSYDHKREQPYEQQYEYQREQPYEHQREHSYDQVRDHSYEHARDLSYDHREQSYEHPPPNVSADYAGSYASALLHGTDNIPRVGLNQNNPQHQNGNVNTMMAHGATANTMMAHGATANSMMAHCATSNAMMANNATSNNMMAHGATANSMMAHGATSNAMMTHNATSNNMMAHGATSNAMMAHCATSNMMAHGATSNAMMVHGANSNNMMAHGATSNTMMAHGATSNTMMAHGATSNTMMAHGATSGHYYSQYESQSAYPYMQQIENGINNNEIGHYSSMAGPVGPVDPKKAEYQQQPYINQNGAGCHFKPISYGITVKQPVAVVQPMPIPQPKEQAWSNATVKSPPMFKFDEMTKNLPIGIEHGKPIPIGMDMLKNKPIGMEMVNNMPIGQNMPPIGMPPTNSDMMHHGMDPRVQQKVVRTATQKRDDQELEKELKALEQRIDSEFCRAVDPLAPNVNANLTE